MRRLTLTLTSLFLPFAAMADIPVAGSTSSNIAASSQLQPHNGFTTMLFFGILIVVFYFFLMRPQMKRNKEQKQMLSSLSVGDEVATVAGIMGKISKINEEVITLEISKGVTVAFQKQSIANILPKGTLKNV